MLTARSRSATQSTPLSPAILSAITVLSTALLFAVLPLFTRIVLPHAGNAPMVWSVAVFFFQIALIGGYLYAHLLTRLLPVRAQVGVHLALWAAALLSLPLGVPEGWLLQSEAWILLQVLGLFAKGIGLPALALAATAPLLSHWFQCSGGEPAPAPFSLFRSSVLVSLIALVSVPFIAAPFFGYHAMELAWAAGFLCLGAGLAKIGLSTHETADPAEAPHAKRNRARPNWFNIAGWAFMAFIPASLLLGVTYKISLEMGAYPLIMLAPLALYLLSVLLAFTISDLIPPSLLTAGGLISFGILLHYGAGLHGAALTWPDVTLLLITFFLLATFAHRRLFLARPPARNLHRFSRAICVGVALGGLFNAVIAPIAFDRMAELGITLGLAGLLFISLARGLGTLLSEGIRGVLVGGLVAIPAYLTGASLTEGDWSAVLLILVVGWSISMTFLRHSAAGAYAATIMLALTALLHAPDDALLRERSFFGLHVVSEADGLRLYSNGTSIKGAQRIEDDRGPEPPEPLYHDHLNGPLAQVLGSGVGARAQRVGLIGLKTGAPSCNRQDRQAWEFFEIDPVMNRIARTPELFRFLDACAPDAPTHLGDPRATLKRQADARYDILIIDTNGTNALPRRLITHEAMQLFLDRLAPDGLLLYRISNSSYDISRALARSAAALGLDARISHPEGNFRAIPEDMSTATVLIARREEALGPFAYDASWDLLESDDGRIWSDERLSLRANTRE